MRNVDIAYILLRIRGVYIYTEIFNILKIMCFIFIFQISKCSENEIAVMTVRTALQWQLLVTIYYS